MFKPLASRAARKLRTEAAWEALEAYAEALNAFARHLDPGTAAIAPEAPRRGSSGITGSPVAVRKPAAARPVARHLGGTHA